MLRRLYNILFDNLLHDNFIENYTEVDLVVEKFTQQPWREEKPFTLEFRRELQEMILSYKRPADDLIYHIMLCGLVGHGKTSVIKTMKTSLRSNEENGERVADFGPIGKTASIASTITRRFRVHQLMPDTSFRICDLMGIEEGKGIGKWDMQNTLNGYIKDNYEYNESKPIQSNSAHFRVAPSLKDKAHCVALVLDANVLNNLGGAVAKSLEELKEEVMKEEHSVIILLTKIDLLCETLNDVFRCIAVKNAVKRAAQLFGIEESRVFPIKNYHNNFYNDLHTDILMLIALSWMLSEAGRYTEDEMTHNLK